MDPQHGPPPPPHPYRPLDGTIKKSTAPYKVHRYYTPPVHNGWCCRRSAPAGGASEALRPGAPAHCRGGAGLQAALHSQGEGVLTSRHPGAGHYLPANVADPECLSWIRIFSIPDPGSSFKRIPGSASASRNFNILTQKIVSKLSEI
jgi:hypothetical protein